jgi:predicted ATP-grasp superfamily ATP-dependent carboligase
MMASDYESMNKRVAVVLNMGANCLGVARSLGQNSILVLGMDFAPRPAGFHSKYVKVSIALTPTPSPDALLEFLVKEGGRLDEKGDLRPFLAQSGYGVALAKEFGSLLKMKVDEDANWTKRDCVR